MTELTETIDLNTSIARLQDFIDTYPDGEQIDGDMPLTVDDVRRVIEAAKKGGDMVAIKFLDLNNPPPPGDPTR